MPGIKLNLTQLEKVPICQKNQMDLTWTLKMIALELGMPFAILKIFSGQFFSRPTTRPPDFPQKGC